jgi:ribosome-associated toxin RatA of RatAB toxin-antitoxin module
MVEHRASVTVDAPLHQVYSLFSHFNDFPKFMSFVKEVTYYDDQRSHWVADVSGQHEWDAVNEDWIPDRQIGWHSVNGLNNYGRVMFQPAGERQTHIEVQIDYHPPAGLLGSIGEHMGVGKHFDDVLQHDLDNFAEMVRQAPVNALDPNSSEYLFHTGSAAAQGKTTERQNATMGGEFSTPEGTRPSSVDPDMPARADYGTAIPDQPGAVPPARGATRPQEDTLADRPVLDQDIIDEPINPAELPPEQLPRWERHEGGQTQP